MIQQALSQVLVPVFDPGFSERSFGFRPGARPTRRSSALSATSPKGSSGPAIWTSIASSIESSTTR
jgi:hypothetical protein